MFGFTANNMSTYSNTGNGQGAGPPSLVSTIKLRQAWFGGRLVSEEWLSYWIAAMQNDGLLPRRPGD